MPTPSSLKIFFNFYFDPFSLKIIRFSTKLDFIHILIPNFVRGERESLENNKEQRIKEIDFPDSIHKNGQIWCQIVSLDKKKYHWSVFFFASNKNKSGLRDLLV